MSSRATLTVSWGLLLIGGLLLLGCAAPVLSQDGQLVFSEGGQRGASVLTANGVQFIDRGERPQPTRRSSAFEPWVPPTGFLLPANGVLTRRSKPISVAGRGVSFVVRTSDVYAPTWGGELLLRVDVMVPAQAFPHLQSELRSPTEMVLVVDFSNPEALELVYTALEQLGAKDRVMVLDARRNQRLVPLLPGTHRALIAGAVEQNLTHPGAPRSALYGALEAASSQLRAAGHRGRALIISDGIGFSETRGGVPERALDALQRQLGERLLLIAADEHSAFPSRALVASGGLEQRLETLVDWLPPPGPVVIHDLTLELTSAPAPMRILEASGSEVEWGLEADRIPLGDFNLGESRTEVLRVSIPEWLEGQPLVLKLRASYRVEGRRGYSRSRLNLGLRYSEDIELLANERNGDVIAYASGLAMVRRLERVFQGSDVDRLGGLTGVVQWQARSLERMARVSRDPSLAQQAEVLHTLLEATE
ncbi:MAG: VWA domain-containing protein [Myxococcales bacterium]|nr:VWA domain-containing protein [Myxococcales bacterium]